jgi:hypothetical protein
MTLVSSREMGRLYVPAGHHLATPGWRAGAVVTGIRPMGR